MWDWLLQLRSWGAQQAARLYGAAVALHAAIGASLEPADWVEWDRTTTDLKAQLNAITLAAALAAGQALAREHAIAEALSMAAEHAPCSGNART